MNFTATTISTSTPFTATSFIATPVINKFWPYQNCCYEDPRRGIRQSSVNLLPGMDARHVRSCPLTILKNIKKLMGDSLQAVESSGSYLTQAILNLWKKRFIVTRCP